MTDSRHPASADRIALIGMGCRLPGGACDPRTFWRNLTEGRDCLVPTPPDRYDVTTLGSRDPAKPGRLTGTRGGYIDGFDEFDPEFFGISPREAAHMDPQQRKLLEVVWEALEDGGQDPAKLAGGQVGVYIGAFTLDYKILQFADLGFGTLAAHTPTGTMMTMVSNRISHCFDFRGPSVSLDTACSSSLVALHLARQSLLRGESDLALAGGTLLHMAPQYTVSETKGGFLSAGGTSRAFDASADGYVRSEGVAVVALKRLDDALRDGDPVHAVVLGSGVNQDGRTNGITVPSQEAQVSLVRQVCAEAGVTPGSLQYVEAHGTSTPVGDPVEAQALGRVLAEGRRPGDACYVGSVKTNIGHTEAAAGLAGLIKTVLCLKHRRIPPHLNLERLNPAIDASALPYTIPTRTVDWPAHTGPARAGVNSFGFGGTNAHVVLEEAPAAPAAGRAKRRPEYAVLPLSARAPEALTEVAAGIRQELAGAHGEPVAPDDLGHTLAHRRHHHEHRLAVVYATHDARRSLTGALAAHERGEPHPRVLTGRARERGQRRLAWVFTGMGPQWWAMGRQLFAAEPVYREAVERCHEEIRRLAGWSLIDELHADEGASRMAQTWLAQPANFAVQTGLAALWRSYGVRPDMIVGHSTGEAAAFHEAGVYSLQDAVAVVVHRSRLQQRLAGTGTMLAVGLPEAEAERRIRPLRGRVGVAAANSPTSTTLAGDTAALRQLADALRAEDVFCRPLAVEVPYHSDRMAPIRDELLASLAGLKPGRAQVPLHLTAREGAAVGTELDADYWWENVRRPVRFRAAVERLAEDGASVFLEIGPHPVLGHAIRECLAGTGTEAVTLPSLRREEDEPEGIARTLAALHTLGTEVAWDVLQPAGRPVPLPRYPWRRDRYWTEPEPVARVRLGRLDHPLLGRRTATTQPTWENRIDTERLPYLADHRIQDHTVFPAAGYLEMAAQAVRALTGGTDVVLSGVEFPKALFLNEAVPSPVELAFTPGDARFTIATAGPDGAVHATGTVRSGQPLRAGAALDPAAVRARTPHRLGHDSCYAALAALGYHYGPAFQGIEEVWTGPGEALARIRPPAGGTDADHAHPTVLDACFQTLLTTLLPAGREGGGIRLPLAAGEVRLAPLGNGPLWAHATVTRQRDGELTGDLALHADDGTPLGRITGFRAADIEAAPASVALSTLDGWLAEPVWTDGPPLPAAEGTPPDLLILTDAGGVGEELAALARARGGRCRLVRPGGAYRYDGDTATVRPDSAADLARLLAEPDAPAGAVVHLWNLDLPAVDDAEGDDLDHLAGLGSYSLVGLAQALPGARPAARLFIVTRATQAVRPGDPVEPLGAPAWGIGRVLWQQELTAHRGRLIDLGPGGGADAAGRRAEAGALLAEVVAATADPDGGEDEVARRGDRRCVSRLRTATGLTRPLPLRLRADGSYLVTGAFGALGRLLCRTLVRRGARRLILAGRTRLPERERWASTDPASPAGSCVAFLRELEALGAQVEPVPLDVTDEAALTAWLAGHRRRGLPPLRGVFHLAGSVRDTLVPEMDRTAFDAGYRPKAIGAQLLHRHLRDEPLDHFVLFASIASVLTTAGQTNYAAGNAFLDALAHHRRAAGLPALSLDWGPWATGMIEELGLIEHYRHARGMTSLRPDTGMAVLERAIGQDRAQLLVATVADWPLFRSWYPVPPPLLAELPATAETPPPATGGLLETFRAAGEEDRRALVTEHFTALVAGVLGVRPERIGADADLGALGLDSLLAMEVRARIHTELGVALPVVALLSGRPAGELAGQVHDALTELAAGGDTGADTAVELHTDERRYPLTHNQQALWFLRQLHPDAYAYNIGGAVEVRTELDPELMFTAFRTLLERHPGLRTNFVLQDGRAVQVVADDPAPDTGLFDVEGREWPEIHRMIVEEYRKPYDLAHDPLVRLRLFRRGPDRWVLMKAVHHIVSDAISTFTFIEELFALYEALRHGRPADLPPLTARYLDFLNRQNTFLAGPDARRMLEYWRERLPADLPVLALPTDRPRPAVLTHNGASEFFVLDAELSARVRELARTHHVTVFMVLLSAYHLLLHRYSGQDDIVVGSPVSGRTEEDFAGVYGYFVNPLPLRVGFDGDPSVAELLDRVRTAVLGGLDNQEYPFGLLVEKLGLEHDPSRSAVFQAMFVLLHHKVATERYGYRLEYIELPEEEGQFDLALSAYEERADGCFHCVVKYNTDLFRPDTVRRMAGHYRNLLDSLTRAPADAPADGLEMLGAGERARILGEWSGADRQAPPPDLPVHELFARVAAAHPETVAVVDPAGDRLTYAALDRRSRAVAARLRELGVGEGTVVALHLDKTPELIAVLLGVLRAGGAYLPLDPAHPADRLADLTARAGAALLVTDRDRPDLARLAPRTVRAAELDGDPAAPPASVGLDAPAYVLGTSGSTGRPKAVEVSHRNLASAYAAWQREYRLGRDVRVHLQMASPAFDVFTGDLVRALCSGGTLVLADRELLFDTAGLYRTMTAERVDCAEFVPAVVRGLLSHCERTGLRLDFLRLLIVGSDVWKAAEHRRLAALCGPATRLVNSYGLTEATIDSACYDGPVDGLEPGRTVPIGRPLPNTTLHLLDRYGAPVPPGVTGELWVGGAGVARGYLNDPEQTARSFTTRHLGGAPVRLYRTGDLARWDADGVLHLLGRADAQIKVRGHRVEPGEIEAWLTGRPDVAQACVTVRPHRGDDVLCAYYVPAADPAPTAAELRRHLTEHLPPSMVPAHLTAVPALPLTPNGKVDTAALPEPRPDADPQTFAPPVTLYERRMADHWQELLGLAEAGLDHDFFAAGGSSVGLIELIARLQDEFAVTLPVGLLFQATTVRGMARALESVVTGRISGAHPYLRFNDGADADRTVFCFPPAGGHGLVYRGLAALLPDRPLLAFNYLPGEDKTARYADLVESVRPDGPCTLFGYSLGGNLAFEVAKELERRGREVTDVVLMDAHRITEPFAPGPDHLAAFEEELRGHLHQHTGSDTVARHTLEQAREFITFCGRTPNLGTVRARISVIADREKLPLHTSERPGSWHGRSATRTTVVPGHGRHADMLTERFLTGNAELTRRILTEGTGHDGA
ncbi:amino acid adenylation domain-containing protein [Streptomyces sp. BBFR2]|uniref:non-ribosomal peptide synthetase/type I polyketide synthase n=1 Tax=Streptomyces sp. BBFR2 TaxID=3372854 RepID=UPI0037D9EB0A